MKLEKRPMREEKSLKGQGRRKWLQNLCDEKREWGKEISKGWNERRVEGTEEMNHKNKECWGITKTLCGN